MLSIFTKDASLCFGMVFTTPLPKINKGISAGQQRLFHPHLRIMSAIRISMSLEATDDVVEIVSSPPMLAKLKIVELRKPIASVKDR